MVNEEVIKEIEAFGREVKRLQNGEIPEEKFKKFRLQQGVYGQRQKGVQMVRVKIPAGTLNSKKLRALANVIETYSTGKGHVTTRQDVQFHFVKLENITAVLYQLAEAGLTTREACGNTVRNVTSCHLAGVCKTELFNVVPISEKVAYHLLRNPINQDLPRKFKISFSGCRSECGMAAIHDIGFIAETREQGGTVEYGFRVYVGGGLGSSPRLAKLYSDFLSFSEVLPTCEAILKIFDANGDRKTRSKARMKFVLEKWGIEKFKTEVAKEIATFYEMGKIYPPLPMPKEEQKNLFVLPTVTYPSGHSDYEKWIRTNLINTQETETVSVQVKLTLGDITVEEIRGLADIVDRFGSQGSHPSQGTLPPMEIRATHQQNFILHGIAPEKLFDLYTALDQVGLSASGAEKAADVIACPGADSCQLALTSSMGVGAAIVDTFAKECADDEDINGLRIRISGCPNSCAHHHIAGIGLHGVAKKVHGKLAPHYQLHLGGGVNADTPMLGRPKLKLPAKNVPNAVMEIVKIYRENRQPNEMFNPFVARFGADAISTKLTRFTELPTPEASPESYRDYKAESDFHLDDLGPGECAGTMIDLIENYLRTSGQSLALAELELRRGQKDKAIDAMKSGILLSCRALLIPFGIESPDEGAILKEFQHKLVEQGIVSERFENFTQGLGQWAAFNQNTESVQTLLKLAEPFLAECQAVYDQMDANMKLKKSESVSPVASSTMPSIADSSRKINVQLDLSGVACPMNFVKTKLKLEDMEAGEVLEVIIDDGAPKDNVPRSVASEGHKILELVKTPDDHYKLVIEKV
jgi:sulfite reductase (ferredoxin)